MASTGFSAPRAGALSTRVALEKRGLAPDGLDGFAETFAPVAEVSARARTLFGGRALDGQETGRRASHVLTIRWRADARAGGFDHLSFQGRRFRVESVEDPDERRTWLELLCQELGAA